VSQCIISISTARRPRSSPNVAAGHSLHLLEASSAGAQHDLAHRPAGDSVNAGQQFRLAGEPAAALMAHAGEDVADRPVTPPGSMCLPALGVGHAVPLASARSPRDVCLAARSRDRAMCLGLEGA
jgi:hypothetical protein